MGLAVATGLVLVVIALIVFHLGTVLTMVLVTSLVTIAAAEAYAAVRRGGYHPATLLGLVATVSLMVATYNKGQAALPLVPCCWSPVACVWYLVGVERERRRARGQRPPCSSSAGSASSAPSPRCSSSPALFPHRHGIAFFLGR